MSYYIATKYNKLLTKIQRSFYSLSYNFPFIFRLLYGYSPSLYAQLRSAYSLSKCSITLPEFIREIKSLAIYNYSSYFSFDETFYLNIHEDVEAEVKKRTFYSGYVHFLLHGQSEGRIVNDRYLYDQYSLTASWSTISDASLQSLTTLARNNDYLKGSIKFDSSKGSDRCLYAYYPHLERELFYAGYTSYSNYLSSLSAHFDHFIILVTESADINIDSTLLSRFFKSYEVVRMGLNCSHVLPLPSLIFTFDAQTTTIAFETHFVEFRHLITYYCQDYEAGFCAFSDHYISCIKSLTLPIRYVVSTPVLLSYLQTYTGSSPQKVHTIAPSISRLDISLKRSNKILFYYRPEDHNARNLPVEIINSDKKISNTLSGYEFILIGTVGPSYSMPIGNNRLSVLSKLSKNEYQNVLREADLVVSLIYRLSPWSHCIPISNLWYPYYY